MLFILRFWVDITFAMATKKLFKCPENDLETTKFMLGNISKLKSRA